KKTLIRYGSDVVLIHVPSKKYLTTEGEKHPEINQSIVVCDNPSENFKNEVWSVIGADGSNVRVGDVVPFNAIIELKHKETGENLYSHYACTGMKKDARKPGLQQATLSSSINADNAWLVKPYSPDSVNDASGNLMSGDVISLFHINNSKPALCSHDVLLDNGTQEVFCDGGGDEEDHKVVGTDQEMNCKNNLWRVMGAYDTNVKTGDPLLSNTIVRFKNLETAGNLHSHSILNGKTPISNQQQVTISFYAHTDDNWIIRSYNHTPVYNYSKVISDGDPISLSHLSTNVSISSHDVLLDDQTQEVSCNGYGHEANNKV
ncbi:10748_t:CDS:2, partial [Acaulospora colombiana]